MAKKPSKSKEDKKKEKQQKIEAEEKLQETVKKVEEATNSALPEVSQSNPESIFKSLRYEEVLSVSKDRTPDAIRNYFSSDQSEHNRKLLYKYYELLYGEETAGDCPRNCFSCMTIDGSYIDCFTILKRQVINILGLNNTEAIRAGEEQIIGNKDNIIKCNTCYIRERCPKYIEGENCAYNFGLDIDFAKDPERAYQFLINAQKERVARGVLFEKVDGGVADKNVTSEIQLLMNMMIQKEEASRPTLDFSMKIKGGSGDNGSFMDKLMSQAFSKLGSGNKKELPAHTEEAVIIKDKEESRNKAD